MAINVNEVLKRQKNKAVSLVIILIALYFAFGIYNRYLKEARVLKEKAETEIKKNEALKGIVKLEETYNEYKNFINHKDTASIISILNSLAAVSTVKILSLRPLPEATDANSIFIKYPFDLKIEAKNYHTLARFISSLESHPFIFEVQTVSLRPKVNPERGQESLLDADLKVQSFLLK